MILVERHIAVDLAVGTGRAEARRNRLVGLEVVRHSRMHWAHVVEGKVDSDMIERAVRRREELGRMVVLGRMVELGQDSHQLDLAVSVVEVVDENIAVDHS